MLEINGKTHVYGLIGKPVEHTLSPLIHNTLASLLDENMVYVPLEVKEPERLGDAIRGAYALDIQGMNVTVPYKSAVIPFLKEIDPIAAQIGAVNTLVRVEGGYKGYNTDYVGLKRALEYNHVDIGAHDVVLVGAGGAARAAGFMSGVCGVNHLVILNRTPEKAKALAEDLSACFPSMKTEVFALSQAAELPVKNYLAIQCTNVGLFPKVEDSPVTDERFFQNADVCYDAIYNPEETRFLQLARQSGTPGWCGLDMLLWQGVAAFEYWTKLDVTSEHASEVRELMREKLGLKKVEKTADDSKVNAAKPDNLVLVGFMGSGKSTVGRALAAKSGKVLKDLDAMIEEEAGMPITEIFSKEGEGGFRTRETNLLKRLVGENAGGCIYSTGGGIVMDAKNRELLHKLGTVVLLDVLPETVVKRLGKDTTRPLLQGPDRMKKVRTLLVRRKEAYEDAADVTIGVDALTPDEIADQILGTKEIERI